MEGGARILQLSQRIPMSLPRQYRRPTSLRVQRRAVISCCNCDRTSKSETAAAAAAAKDEDETTTGVKLAVAALNFYKREISPCLPGSCRFVPTCSDYSIQAYKRYGVFKGTVLTAWRLARCNPLGPSGFDPPRWFGEEQAKP